MIEHKNAWLRVIDEALVAAHIGTASESDDYQTAKKKLGELIDWHVADEEIEELFWTEVERRQRQYRQRSK